MRHKIETELLLRKGIHFRHIKTEFLFRVREYAEPNQDIVLISRENTLQHIKRELLFRKRIRCNKSKQRSYFTKEYD